jgi:hypothetical protein
MPLRLLIMKKVTTKKVMTITTMMATANRTTGRMSMMGPPMAKLRPTMSQPYSVVLAVLRRVPTPAAATLLPNAIVVARTRVLLCAVSN